MRSEAINLCFVSTEPLVGVLLGGTEAVLLSTKGDVILFSSFPIPEFRSACHDPLPNRISCFSMSDSVSDERKLP